ncbi:hypothetical protein J2X54_002451 [Duganella sp. 3397]|uniref:glycine-rich domain-containing protein n=1 Tax=Duganella sp. 3397 TaxID=2817732 RepID=UPI002865160B|nr:hypothetical protein [Duganella sp. 3397]MDR7049996.1 hypothetical protein [Duganella sp. 3397]
MSFLLIVAITCLACGAGTVWQRQRRTRREAHIRTFLLPDGLFEALRVHHPQLTPKDCHLVAQGLRQFFLVHLKGRGQFVSMPSQVVDDLWHEFILYTRAYEKFCHKAFGGLLHHTPAIALDQRHRGNDGIRRSWRLACAEENIDPRNPSRLPLLFALDSKLAIPNGFVYVPDCDSVARKGGQGGAGGGDTYCGAHLGGSDSGGTSGAGNGSDRIGDSSGDSDSGGGCGGGGCGGGGD